MKLHTKLLLIFALCSSLLLQACAPSGTTTPNHSDTNAPNSASDQSDETRSGSDKTNTGQTSSNVVSEASGAERFRGQFLGVFDTVTTVIALTNSEAEFQDYLDQIQEELTHYHQLYDGYNNYEGINNIKTINDHAGIAPVEVDPAIIQLLEQSIEANRLSKGYVNVAFGAVLKIWHDYREEGIDDPLNARLPQESELREAEKHTDISKIQIDKEKNTVFLPDNKMSLDVGSGAKGLACEIVAQKMQERGLKNALISVGGNVRALGYRDGVSVPWNVGIQDPQDSTNSQYIRIARVHDMAVVSSGVYERYYDVEGVRYHHIIHPDSLFPKNEFDAVTIIAKSSGFADSLTTALFNMNYADGLAFIDSLDDVAALWIKGDEVLYSERMSDYIVDTP